MKITYNALSRNAAGRYYWRDSGRWANRSEIKQFKKIRSRAAIKREKEFKVFKAEFKHHVTISKNVYFITYCIPYDNGKGIEKLARLYNKIYHKKGDHTRFYIGKWIGYCFDKTMKCSRVTITAHKKKDKYKIPREQPVLTKDNFIEQYKYYIDEIFPYLIMMYKSEICPRCPSGDIIIRIKNICFQIVRVK